MKGWSYSTPSWLSDPATVRIGGPCLATPLTAFLFCLPSSSVKCLLSPSVASCAPENTLSFSCLCVCLFSLLWGLGGHYRPSVRWETRTVLV